MKFMCGTGIFRKGAGRSQGHTLLQRVAFWCSAHPGRYVYSVASAPRNSVKARQGSLHATHVERLHRASQRKAGSSNGKVALLKSSGVACTC